MFIKKAIGILRYEDRLKIWNIFVPQRKKTSFWPVKGDSFKESKLQFAEIKKLKFLWASNEDL